MELVLVIAISFFWDVLNSVVNNLPLYLLLALLIKNVLVGKRAIVKKEYLILFAIIAAHGILNIALGNNTTIRLLIQIASIVVCFLEYNFVVERFGVEKVFIAYWKSAVIMAMLACIQEITGVLGMGTFDRIPLLGIFFKNYEQMSVMVKTVGACSEPSFLGCYLMPCVCIACYYCFNKKELPDSICISIKKYQAVLVITASIITFSAVAYVGIILSFVLVIGDYKKFSLKKASLIIVMLVAMIVVYNAVPSIKMRIDDTLVALSGAKMGNINLSSATWTNNLSVTISSVKYTYGLGSGLGSCETMFDKFSTGTWGGRKLLLNRQDANSMLFRLLIELGIWGVLLVIWFFTKYRLPKKSVYYSLQTAVLVLVAILLLRQGNYTHGGILLFFVLYKEAYKAVRLSSNISAVSHEYLQSNEPMKEVLYK